MKTKFSARVWRRNYETEPDIKTFETRGEAEQWVKDMKDFHDGVSSLIREVE